MAQTQVRESDARLTQTWNSAKTHWKTLFAFSASVTTVLTALILASYFSLIGYSPQSLSLTDIIHVSVFMQAFKYALAIGFGFIAMGCTFIPVFHPLLKFAHWIIPSKIHHPKPLQKQDYMLAISGIFMLIIMIAIAYSQERTDILFGLLASSLFIACFITALRNEEQAETTPHPSTYVRTNIAISAIVILLFSAPFLLIPQFGANTLKGIMADAGIRIPRAVITIDKSYAQHVSDVFTALEAAQAEKEKKNKQVSSDTSSTSKPKVEKDQPNKQTVTVVTNTKGKTANSAKENTKDKAPKTFYTQVEVLNNVLGSHKLIKINEVRFLIPHDKIQVAF